MQWALVALALVAGILMPVQAGINAKLKGYIGSPEAAALISFAVGTLGLAAYVAMRGLAFPLRAAWSASPAWVWLGGLLGAFFVAATVVLAYRLGAATMMALLVAGQLAGALVLDHFALLGYPEHPISLGRMLGVACLVAGVILIRR